MIDDAVRVSVTGAADARRSAVAALEGFFTPPPVPQVEEWLAELSVITRRKQEDDVTERLRLAAYCARLARYPADVVAEALLRHRWLFFPAWAELEEVCEKLITPRRAMLWHLENAPQAQEQPEPVSAEKRAEMAAYAQRVTQELAERASNGN